MSLRSTPPSQSPIAAMSPKPKSTSSMAATSPWTPPQAKSPHWSRDSSVLHVRALRRGEQGEAAFERDGAGSEYSWNPRGVVLESLAAFLVDLRRLQCDRYDYIDLRRPQLSCS